MISDSETISGTKMQSSRSWLDDREVRGWLDDVPHPKKHLANRLQSDDMHQSYPALWELIWREAAKRRWTLAPKAQLGRKTPDQLIDAPHPFALEVVTVHETWIERQTAVASELRHALNAVPTNVVWSLHMTSTFPYHYSVEDAVRRFRAGVLTELPSGARRLLCDAAGVVQLEPHPKLTGSVTGVHITDFGARFLSNDHILWEAIDEKAVAYRPDTLGDLPLVVAACSAPEYGFDLNDMTNALCGRWVMSWQKEVATGRILSSDGQRPGGWFLTENRTHVAAIIFASQLTFTPLTAEAHVFTNPYAAHPLPLDTFFPWPTTKWSVATPDEAKADWVGNDPTLVLR